MNSLEINTDDIKVEGSSENSYYDDITKKLAGEMEDTKLTKLGRFFVQRESDKERSLYKTQFLLGGVAHKAAVNLNESHFSERTITPSFQQFSDDIGKAPTTLFKKYIPFYTLLNDFPLLRHVTNVSKQKMLDYRTQIIKHLKSCEPEERRKWQTDGREQNLAATCEDPTNDTQCKATTYSGERCKKGAPEGDFCKTHT